jgi:hypothetical protein
MIQQYRFTRPPQVLQNAKLDNITLVPASALPFKAQCLKIANSLPKGSVLLCHSGNAGQHKLLERVSGLLQQRGHRVTMLSTGGMR